MLETYQVTLFCADGRYKPVSALVQLDVEQLIDTTHLKTQLKREGIQKICAKRYWTQKDLFNYGYTKIKFRKYIPK